MKKTEVLSLVLTILLCASISVLAQVPAVVTEPITIQIWHTRGAGANGDQIAAAVEEFNATNPYGITVEEVYQGNYVNTLAKTMQSLAAGTNPELVVLERAAARSCTCYSRCPTDMTPMLSETALTPKTFHLFYWAIRTITIQLISYPISAHTAFTITRQCLLKQATPKHQRPLMS